MGALPLMSKTVAYLTMSDPADYVTDYHLSFDDMQALGWRVSEVPWRSNPDWNTFDAVYICAPWDYPQHADEFIAVLAQIEASSAVLSNSLATVKWNLQKTYLRDIEVRGNRIVPTLWYETFEASELTRFFSRHDADKVVIKPTIGANAADTYVLQQPVNYSQLQTLQRVFSKRAFLVQPFAENIQREGEYSLFYFNGEYSHAIVKTPKDGDFRVQEEHGANIASIDPPDGLLNVAASVFSQIEPVPVYGRGDWVRGVDGDYWLMELELIEPSLYLRTDRRAAARFALAFDQRFQEVSGK